MLNDRWASWAATKLRAEGAPALWQRAGDLFWVVASLCSASSEGQVHHWENKSVISLPAFSWGLKSVYQVCGRWRMPWLKMNTKVISPGALHLLLDFDCFIDYKEDFIQDIFRDLGLGETLLKKVVSQSELPAKIFEFSSLTFRFAVVVQKSEFWSQWVVGLV